MVIRRRGETNANIWSGNIPITKYLAFGIPTVATNVGNTPNVITHEEDGFLVESRQEWLYALEKLVKNTVLRREMGKKARIKAEEKYSQNVVCDSYVKVLNLCAGKNLWKRFI